MKYIENTFRFDSLFRMSLLCLFVAIGFNPFNLNAQTYSSIINDSLITSFIQKETESESNYLKRFYQIKKKIKYKPINWKQADWDIRSVSSDTISFNSKFYSIRDSLSKYFTEPDLDFFREQYNGQIISEWKIKSKKGRFLKTVKSNYYEYSIPLFSKNFKYALFYEYYFCGSVCAYSGLWIYQWDGKTWIRFKYLKGWIS